jgi:cysteinyl-tRNA synthetase
MDDDFGTAQAAAVLFDLAREINRAGEAGLGTSEACSVLVELAGVLGLTLKQQEEQTFEAELYQKSLVIDPVNVDAVSSFLEQVRESLPRIESNIGTLSNLNISLRDELVHEDYPSLSVVEELIRDFDRQFGSLKSRITDPLEQYSFQFQAVQEDLRGLADISIVNVKEYSEIRSQCRANRQFQPADEIRNEISKMEITLEDTPQGTIWKRKR